MINIKTVCGSNVFFNYLDKIPNAPESAIGCQVLRTTSDINGNPRAAILYYGMDGDVCRIVYIEDSRISIPGNLPQFPTMKLKMKDFRDILSVWATRLTAINYHSEIIAV